MNKLVAAAKRFLSEEEGVTAIEYGLIAALIAVVIIAAVAMVGTRLTCIFEKVAGCLVDADNVDCLKDCGGD
jgi:pilus assembly protein Flp/PilA